MVENGGRALMIEELAGGEARVTVGGELGTSMEVYNGKWMNAKAFSNVSLNCPQTEEGILTAQGIAEELAFEKVYELMANAEQSIEDAKS